MNPNKKTLFVFVLIASLFVLALTACSSKPLTAEEVLKQSGEKMAEVNSMQISAEIGLNSQGMTIAIPMEIAMEKPEKAYIKLSVMGQEMEVVVLSKDEVYIKTPPATIYEQVPADQLGTAGGIDPSMAAGLADVTDIATNLVKEKDEKLDNVDCYVVSFEVSLSDLLAKIGPEVQDALTGMELQPLKGMMWVGKKDLLIRKIDMSTSLTSELLSGDLTITLNFEKFNETVEIPNPK